MTDANEEAIEAVLKEISHQNERDQAVASPVNDIPGFLTLMRHQMRVVEEHWFYGEHEDSLDAFRELAALPLRAMISNGVRHRK